MTMTSGLQVLLAPDALREALLRDARRGLTATPKWLPPKYFYDARGSELFEEITRLPEYYPTRAERALLEASVAEIAEAAGADALVELGSGSSAKTRLLLDAMQPRAYVPVDVSPAALTGAIAELATAYPAMAIHGVVADFEEHLGQLPVPGHRLVAFLGSTIGNLEPLERIGFLGGIHQALLPGEALLLGVDLVKEPERLVAAYDDSAGVTAAFNRNVLEVLNRELDGDLDVTAFEHVAVWDPHQEWVEMRLRATRSTRGTLGSLDLTVEWQDGEEMRTEISAKFRRERIAAELETAGFHLERWWTDGDVALALARRP